MAAQVKVPSLALDYDMVLSAWEELGGNTFAADAVFLDDPDKITLDLSSFEASLCCGATGGFSMFGMVPGVVGPALPDFAVPNMPCGKVETPDSTEELSFCETAFNWGTTQSNCNGQQGFLLEADWCFDGKGFDLKQEPVFQELGVLDSPSATSCTSQDLAVVPDVTSSFTGTMQQHNNCPFGLVPQGIPCGNLGLPLMPVPVCPSALKPPGEQEVRTRKECLERYKEKKARRLYTKKIRYQLRKINADKRPRIKGRFVKKEELEEYLKQKHTGDDGNQIDLDCSDIDDDDCDCE